MVKICQFGAGRIGVVHAANIAAHPNAALRWVVDVRAQAASALAEAYGAQAGATPEAALADPEVDAVAIASSTDTHVDLILAAARAGKPVFCEKPIDLDLERVDACLREVARLGVPLMIGFNRRFDPNFQALHGALRAGEVGKLEVVKITSRDPAPPPVSYIQVSGGLFRDMMIHDFDMARWLMGEDPVEVYAAASCLVDAEIGRAGDVDTAMVVMVGASGVLCHIDNSRRAVYGYDQRIEVLGEKGMLQAGNPSPTTLERWTDASLARDKPPYFFLERYADAYRTELDHFIRAVQGEGELPVTGRDGRQALVLADAAAESLRMGRAVKVTDS